MKELFFDFLAGRSVMGNIFLLCLVMLSSCPIDMRDYAIDKGCRAYIEFNPGSYWIYEDSLTGALDSVAVTGLEYPWRGGSVPGDDAISTLERIEVTWHSSFWERDERMKTYFACEPSFDPDYYGCNFTSLGIVDSTEELAYDREIFKYPLELGRYKPHPMSKSLVTGIYDSFVMDGKLFLNVCKTSIESSPRSNQFTSHFYLAPYVGIIRREELTDSLGWQVWKLKRYRIEP